MANIEFSGMDELLAKLQDIADNVAKTLIDDALKAAAIPVLEEAKNTSAFADRTGSLREGLRVGAVKAKNGTRYIEVGIGKGDITKMFYGKFVEWGTSKEAARPFLQPALEKNKDTVKDIMENELRRGLGL